jgi:hypothetical protein
MVRRPLSFRELDVLAKFNLDPDIDREYSGKTTIDGESFDLEDEEPEEEERPHCHECAGSGQGRHGGTCPECRGWGVLPTEAEIEEAAEAEIEAKEW